MKQRIGISFCPGNNGKTFENYWKWMQQGIAGEMELVELSFEKNNVGDIATCDGFVMTGGVDIHPSFYHGKISYSGQPEQFITGRDEFEKKIYTHSQLHKLPVLAICRGMQLVNVLEKGKLLQNLDDEHPGANAIHEKREQADRLHEVSITGTSLLAEIAGTNTGSVNSAHHQAVHPGAIGEGLLINAYSKGEHAIIEGLEFKLKEGKAFMLGVQWHPERMTDRETNPLSQKIRARFIEEVRKQKNIT